MNANFSSSISDPWFIAAWTMIHFLWLGTAVAAAAFICRTALRRATPNVRYVTAFVFLVILAALPVVLTGWLVNHAPALANANSSDPLASAAQPLPSADGQPVIELNTPGASLVTPKLIVKNQPSDIRITARPTAKEPTGISINSIENGIGQGVAWLGRCIPYLPWLWLIGTPITFVLLLTGLVGSRRLSTASRPIVDGPIAALFTQLITSLSITRRITIATCDRIAAPVLIGIVRPIILLPPAALTGWSPDELEMVLLHELAHVRRWDNLINLLQRCLESLLFFHPAVWLISSWVRDEREACCDDAVVARTNRPHAYAELLIHFASQIQPSPFGSGQVASFPPLPLGEGRGEGALPKRRPRLSLPVTSAMAAGPLRSRIRRILQLEHDPMLISTKSFALTVAAFALAATLGLLYLPTVGHAEPSAPGDTENTEADQTKKQRGRNENPTTPHTSEFTHVVQFERGAERFLNGDDITIQEIRGTAETFAPDNKYSIKGTYKLSSHDGAQLSAFVTVNDSAHAKSPIDKLQTKRIDRGQGEFTLILSLKHEGSPHVSFYPADGGQSFGGIYFGTGDSVLKKWWGEGKSSEKRADKAEDKSDAKQNDESTRLAGFEAALKTIENVVVLFNGEKAFRDSLHEWHKAAAKQTRSLYTYGFNVDPGSADAGRYSLTAAAACVVFRNGQEVARLSPVVSDERLRKFLDVTFADDRAEGEKLALDTRATQDSTASKSPVPEPKPSSKFPSLEDQKLADVAWKLLNVELEPLSDADLKRVTALGYDGGVSVATTTNADKVNILTGDILIALHVWPTRSIKDVIEVLKRDDVTELNPLKFYVIRRPGGFSGQASDEVQTGRINLWTKPAKAHAEGQPAASSVQVSLGPVGPVQPANPFSGSAESLGTGMTPQPVAPPSLRAPVAGGFAPQPTPAVAPAGNAFIPTSAPQLSPVPAIPPGPTNSAFGMPDPLTAPGQPPLKLSAAPSAGGDLFQAGPPMQSNSYGVAPVAPAFSPYPGAPPANSELRYDNKSFQQWQRQLDQAVSNRWADLTALRALEAFAAAGLESEANRAILQGVYSDLAMAQHTRKYLSTLSKPVAAPLVEGLRTVLKNDLSPRRRTAAIRALAALGPNSEPAMEDLKKSLTSKSQEESIAAATAIKRIVGKDQYQKPIADVLGDQLGIKVVKTESGAWGAVPSENATDADAFNKFTEAVIKEQESLFPEENTNKPGAEH